MGNKLSTLASPGTFSVSRNVTLFRSFGAAYLVLPALAFRLSRRMVEVRIARASFEDSREEEFPQILPLGESYILNFTEPVEDEDSAFSVRVILTDRVLQNDDVVLTFELTEVSPGLDALLLQTAGSPSD